MANSNNTLTAFNPQYWTAEMQGVFHRENVAIALANTELRDVLVNGTRVHKPYRGPLAAQTYTKGQDITTFNDLASTDDYLDVDTTKVVPFYVDEIIEIVHVKLLKLLERLGRSRILAFLGSNNYENRENQQPSLA